MKGGEGTRSTIRESDEAVKEEDGFCGQQNV
jgi:hypothetical protein